jgi:hypothetical protein
VLNFDNYGTYDPPEKIQESGWTLDLNAVVSKPTFSCIFYSQEGLLKKLCILPLILFFLREEEGASFFFRRSTTSNKNSSGHSITIIPS